MKQIIEYNGSLTHITNDRLSKNFTVSEFDCFGNILIARPLIELLQALRDKTNAPVSINSGYRTLAYQKDLKKKGFKAATESPHVVGMAADIETKTFRESNETEQMLWNIAKELRIKIRTGNKLYQKREQTFVHVDVCPMYYAPGLAYHNTKHPLAWELQIKW